MLDVDSKIVTSNITGIDFDLCFQHVATGFPGGIILDPDRFVRPQQPTSTGLSLLAKDAGLNSLKDNVVSSVQPVVLNTEECVIQNIE